MNQFGWITTGDGRKVRMIKGYEIYCRFREGIPNRLKTGPRGGIYALVNSQWRYARKTRAKSREV